MREYSFSEQSSQKNNLGDKKPVWRNLTREVSEKNSSCNKREAQRGANCEQREALRCEEQTTSPKLVAGWRCLAIREGAGGPVRRKATCVHPNARRLPGGCLDSGLCRERLLRAEIAEADS